MEKIKLEICCGTTCYMLGSSKLMNIEETFPEAWRDLIEVVGRACMNECVSEKLGGAPFVRINGKLLAQATPERVIDELARLVGEA